LVPAAKREEQGSEAHASAEPGQRARRRAMKWWHIVLWALFALLLLALWVWQTFQEEEASATRTAIAASNPPADVSDLRLDAWANDAQVAARDPLSFSLSIHNPTDKDVSVSITDFRRPGFDAAGPAQCWSKEGVPICTGPDLRSAVKYPVKISPQNTLTIQGSLKAGEKSGRYGISAVVVWQRDQPSAIRRKLITLRPITVEGRIASTVLLSLRAFQSFAKDLAMPLALAFLAYWLKQQEDLRSEQRKTDEEARAQRRKDEEEARAQRRREEEEARLTIQRVTAERSAQAQQAWNLMLPRLHQNTEKFYMPILQSAYWIRHAYSEIPSKGDVARHRCFFYFLRFNRQMTDMANEIGGIYLKSRSGEGLIAAALFVLLGWAHALFGETGRDAAVSILADRQLNFAEFEERFIGRRQIAALRTAFEGALARPDEMQWVTAVLILFEKVLERETNRAYEFWYEELESIDVAAFEKAASDFRAAKGALPPPPAITEKLAQILTEFDAEIDRYRRAVIL